MKGGPNCDNWEHRKHFWNLIGKLSDEQRERLGLKVDCLCDFVPLGNASSAIDADRLMHRAGLGPNGLPRLGVFEVKGKKESRSWGQARMEDGIYEVRFPLIRVREDAKETIDWLFEEGK